ncbi:MAG: 3-deoxy-manno-octulosonate cytidylyltransferase [Prevotellaceae bacterium]|jgi:3-deoxy-manno-octulosonate cytidylyltransferase (CMP-KDO synthetase)|nr:3-deoxy-manno-octulosonate cytidylyltransferase [Prevotellaceae bacterium]
MEFDNSTLFFAGIIPARFASTRFPGKPLADILGKPMIQHVYERAQNVFETVCAATDDKRIFDAVVNFGGNAVMTSCHHSSGTDRCAEAVDIMQKQFNKKIDVVVNIQGDEPFIAEEQLQTLKKLFDNDEIHIATLVKPFADSEDIFNPNSPKVVVSKTNEALYFSRSPVPFVRGSEKENWQRQFTFFKHIGLYAYRTDILKQLAALPQGNLEKAESLEQLRWLENGYRIKVAQTNIENHAVDTPDDLMNLLASRNGLEL